MKIKDNNLCTFCEQQPETLEHLLAECHYSSELWKEIEICLADQGLWTAGSVFSIQEKLSGFTDGDIMTNKLLLLIRKHIYFRNLKGMKPNFRDWKHYLKHTRDTEFFAAVLTMEKQKFNDKWDRLKLT